MSLEVEVKRIVIIGIVIIIRISKIGGTGRVKKTMVGMT